jgi:hypothetical protein
VLDLDLRAVIRGTHAVQADRTDRERGNAGRAALSSSIDTALVERDQQSDAGNDESGLFWLDAVQTHP